MNEKIKLGLPIIDKMILIVLPPIIGGVIGWYAPIISEWLVKLPFIPYGQVLQWITTFNNPWMTSLTLCIGIIAGIIFTMYALSESLKITLHDQEIETSVKDHKQTFAKRDLSAIYIDEKQLIFLGNDDQELFRETKPENKTEVIRDAFEKYGYPWKEQDPFTGQYFLWVEQHPELDTQTNALLTAREIALEKKQDKKIADLRKELANIGIVIYDEAGKQYVRKTKSEGYKCRSNHLFQKLGENK